VKVLAKLVSGKKPDEESPVPVVFKTGFTGPKKISSRTVAKILVLYSAERYFKWKVGHSNCEMISRSARYFKWKVGHLNCEMISLSERYFKWKVAHLNCEIMSNFKFKLPFYHLLSTDARGRIRTLDFRTILYLCATGYSQGKHSQG